MANFSDNLVGHWLMNDDLATTAVLDTTGVNNGTLNVNTDTISVAGKINKALDFDGTDDYLTVVHSASLQINGAISISLWINTSALTGSDGGLISKSDDSRKYFGMSAIKVYELGILGNVLYFQVSDGTIANNVSGSISSLINGAWHHIVATWDGTTNADGIKIYFDGVETYTGTATIAAIQNKTSVLDIGGYNEYPFKGKIDDVRIYDTAISAYYVKLLYNNGAGTEDENIQSNTLLLGCNF